MEQLEQPIYRFTGFVRSEDGTIQPISVAIFPPRDSGKGDSVCVLSCPFLRAKPFSIFGVDHIQALQLSRRFVEVSLEYMNATLLDDEGTPVELPQVPEAGSLNSGDPP